MKPLYIKGTMVDSSQLSFSFLSYFVTFSANDREMRNCCRVENLSYEMQGVSWTHDIFSKKFWLLFEHWITEIKQH